METPSEFKIKRKPLNRHIGPKPAQPICDNDRKHEPAKHLPRHVVEDMAANESSVDPGPIIHYHPSNEATCPGSVTDPNVGSSQLALISPPPLGSEPPGEHSHQPPWKSAQEISPLNQEASKDDTDTKSFWNNAWDEARFIAGGLMSHPHESTKHYTILRHSTSLVFYRGPATSVAITVFSSSQPDTPLPPDRTVWLQQRGFSGNTGMKLKRLAGATGTWLDVTPMVQVSPNNVSPNDERAWQRDIVRFLKKADRDKSLVGRVPRETHVVRVPAAAQDGYFRLVVCTGGATSSKMDVAGGSSTSTRRRALCASPIFRIASTSTDSSILRGASLKTLPLELGVKIGSTVGQGAAMNFVSPISNTIQTTIQRYQPGFVATQAATTAYDASGIGDKVGAVGDQYERERETSYDVFGDMEEGSEFSIDVVGPDAGPEKPYPVKFQGKVSKETVLGSQASGIRTAHLIDVPDDIKLRLRGVYMGWACILPNKTLDGISLDWHEAVIAVGPSQYACPSIIVENRVTACIIHEFGDKTLFNAKVKIIVMGFLRPLRPEPTNCEVMDESVTSDVEITLSSLSRSNWGPVMTLETMKTAKRARSFSEKYADVRLKAQMRADSVPLHWAGIRTSGAELRDRALGPGGFWIAR